MKIFLLVLLTLSLVLLAGPVLASPFADTNIDTVDTGTAALTSCAVTLDGGTAFAGILQTVSSPAGVRCRYDLGSIPNGAHTITMQNCNVWGCNAPFPFSFTKQVPAATTSINLDTQ